MGAGASTIPDELDEKTCRAIAGKNFDEGLFQSISSNGIISKKMFFKLLGERTDAFLTHDWGRELGVDNHARVALVNNALQKRGIKTWFDEEQMQGNIKKQMVGGIDNAQCVVVFITRRYVEKVKGENAEDNCQLEFNYSALRKTGAKMLPVVMEERMKNTRAWGGEVAMVLGGRLYIDLCGDLNDSVYLEQKMQELHDAIIAMIETPVSQFHLQQVTDEAPAQATPVPAIQSNSTPINEKSKGKALISLTVEEVAIMMDSLKLNAFKDAFIKNAVDGACLQECESIDELKELGVNLTAKAKVLATQLIEFRINGVPLELLIASAAPITTTAAANIATVSSPVKVIETPPVVLKPIAPPPVAVVENVPVKHVKTLLSVEVCAGWYVDHSTFHYEDGTKSSGGMMGGTKMPPFTMKAGEYINKVTYYEVSNTLRSLQFTTNLSRHSPVYGGRECTGGKEYCSTAKAGEALLDLTRKSIFCGPITNIVFGPAPASSAQQQQQVQSSSRKVSKITIFDGWYVDYSIFQYTNGDTQEGGATGGAMKAPFQLGEDEFISQVDYYQDNECLRRLSFVTNKGRSSPVYGGQGCSGGNNYSETARQGCAIIGLQRRTAFCGIITKVLQE